MKKILIINTAGLGVGGITTHILNYIKRLDLREIKIDLIQTIYYTESVKKEFGQLGCHVITFPNRKKEIFKYVSALRKLVEQEKYDIIHVHGNSATMCIELSIARKNGVQVRIAHSHNSICAHKILHTLLSADFKKSYTIAAACSKEAGDWIFGKGNFLVLKNGIETDRYKYNKEWRNQYRHVFKADDKTFLMANIGNLVEQKNQRFLLPIIDEVSKLRRVRLAIIGEGEENKKIQQEIISRHLEDVVTIYNYRDDIEKCLSAFDCILLPSKWEGIPLVLVEAQAAGLPCIVSDCVSKEVAFEKSEFYFLPLQNEDWLNKMLKLVQNKNRELGPAVVKEAGYDIGLCVQKLNDIYMRG